MKSVKIVLGLLVVLAGLFVGGMTGDAASGKLENVTKVTYSQHCKYQAAKIGDKYIFINLTGKSLYMSANYKHGKNYVMGHKGNQMGIQPNGDDVITIKPHGARMIATRPQGKTAGKYKVETCVAVKLAPLAKTVDRLTM